MRIHDMSTKDSTDVRDKPIEISLYLDLEIYPREYFLQSSKAVPEV